MAVKEHMQLEISTVLAFLVVSLQYKRYEKHGRTKCSTH